MSVYTLSYFTGGAFPSGHTSHMDMKYVIFVFFCSLLSGGRVFLLALSAEGQASLPWVHYEACLDLG